MKIKKGDQVLNSRIYIFTLANQGPGLLFYNYNFNTYED
jgi:hypothetical protein